MQELVCSQGSGTDLGAAKAQIAAKLAGLSLATKSDSAAVHLVELKLHHGTLFGENAVARHIAIAAEAGLYPANAYDEQSRQSAAAIDGWIEFSAYEIQWRLRQLLAATSGEVQLPFFHNSGLPQSRSPYEYRFAPESHSQASTCCNTIIAGHCRTACAPENMHCCAGGSRR